MEQIKEGQLIKINGQQFVPVTVSYYPKKRIGEFPQVAEMHLIGVKDDN